VCPAHAGFKVPSSYGKVRFSLQVCRFSNFMFGSLGSDSFGRLFCAVGAFVGRVGWSFVPYLAWEVSGVNSTSWAYFKLGMDKYIRLGTVHARE